MKRPSRSHSRSDGTAVMTRRGAVHQAGSNNLNGINIPQRYTRGDGHTSRQNRAVTDAAAILTAGIPVAGLIRFVAAVRTATPSAS